MGTLSSRSRAWLFALLVPAACAYACGDSNDTTTFASGGAGAGGKAGGGGKAGTSNSGGAMSGGTSGSSGKGGSAGTAGAGGTSGGGSGGTAGDGGTSGGGSGGTAGDGGTSGGGSGGTAGDGGTSGGGSGGTAGDGGTSGGGTGGTAGDGGTGGGGTAGDGGTGGTAGDGGTGGTAGDGGTSGGGTGGTGGTAGDGGASGGGTGGTGGTAGDGGTSGGGTGGSGGASFQCDDQADNDEDGFIDDADPGCTAPDDDNEQLFSDVCGAVETPVYDVTLEDTTQDVLVTGSTVGAEDLLEPTDDTDDCVQASGGEVVLLYRVFESMPAVTITTAQAGTDFDTVLYVRRAECGDGAVEICRDDDNAPTVRTSTVTLDMPPGDYFIIVDGFDEQEVGNFELVIDIPNG